MHLMDRLFRLRERGTTIRIEILGGATTFVTMAYIIVLNPSILSVAVPKAPLAPSKSRAPPQTVEPPPAMPSKD